MDFETKYKAAILQLQAMTDAVQEVYNLSDTLASAHRDKFLELTKADPVLRAAGIEIAKHMYNEVYA